MKFHELLAIANRHVLDMNMVLPSFNPSLKERVADFPNSNLIRINRYKNNFDLLCELWLSPQKDSGVSVKSQIFNSQRLPISIERYTIMDIQKYLDERLVNTEQKYSRNWSVK
jgi:hypothetical protein